MGCANPAKWVFPCLSLPFCPSPFQIARWPSAALSASRPAPPALPQVREFPTARPCTWGDNADGHEQDMLLLVQVQLLQPHLELDEGLNQLQAVSGYEKDGQMLWAELRSRLPKPPRPTSNPDWACLSPFSPSCRLAPSDEPDRGP